MRVYERKIDFDFDYPNDMKMILDYLNEHGEILVGELGIESLYYEFSKEKYEAGSGTGTERSKGPVHRL